MNSKKILLACASGITVLTAFSGQASAANIALGKSYTWDRLPGQRQFYRDDSSIYGEHAVYSNGVGAFSPGDLTDGQRQGGSPDITALSSPIVTQWGGQGNVPAASVLLDLGDLFSVNEIILGTFVTSRFNNSAPSEVTVSFSQDNSAFFGAETFDLETLYGPLNNGSHDLGVGPFNNIVAQYINFAFAADSMQDPDGRDPDEKWMLDEIIVHGEAVSAPVDVPEPASMFGLLAIGGIAAGSVLKKKAIA